MATSLGEIASIMDRNRRIQSEPWQAGAQVGGNIIQIIMALLQAKKQKEAEAQAQGYLNQTDTSVPPPPVTGTKTIPVLGGGTTQMNTVGETAPVQTPNPNVQGLASMRAGGVEEQVAGGNAMQALIQMMQLEAAKKKAATPMGVDLARGAKYIDPTTGRTIAENPYETTVKPNLPEGFSQITDPETKAKLFNTTYGTNIPASAFTEKAKESPESKPYVTKLLDKVRELRAANPNDPELKIYEDVIKRQREGIPSFQAVETSEGITPWNSKKGTFGTPSGEYKQPPGAAKNLMYYLDNTARSASEVDSLIKRWGRNRLEELTGPVRGTAVKIGMKFFPAEQAQELKSTLGQLRTIIYGLSGKQINEQEQKWLNEDIISELSEPTPNFLVKLRVLQKWVDGMRNGMKTQYPGIKGEFFNEDKPGATSKKEGDFEVGKTYVDANGNKAKYEGNGRWTEISK